MVREYGQGPCTERQDWVRFGFGFGFGFGLGNMIKSPGQKDKVRSPKLSKAETVKPTSGLCWL